MIVATVFGLFVLLSAASTGLMEKALGPESGRFPCVGRELIWGLRLYATCLFWRASSILVDVYHRNPPDITVDQFIAAGAHASVATMLLIAVLRLRLPEGTWRRLQARTRKAASVGGAAGALMAKAVADLDPVHASPMHAVPADLPREFHGPLRRLSRRG